MKFCIALFSADYYVLRQNMIKYKHIATFWGVVDLLMIAWYVTMNIKNNHIPIIHDILSGKENFKAFGLQNYAFFSYIVVLLYVSPLLSGVLLIFQKKAGMIVSYIQTPFRLVSIIPPSLFFILWPLNDSLSKTTILVLALSLIIFSEAIKIGTLIIWDKRRRT